jgi:hypothetical protein
VSMVGPPKTDCPRVREKVIWESLYPILGSIRPHGLVPNFTEERVKRFARILESNESFIDVLWQLTV